MEGKNQIKRVKQKRIKFNVICFILYLARIKVRAKERQEINESVKNLKKAIVRQKKRIENSQANISIPLSYMSTVKRIKNM